MNSKIKNRFIVSAIIFIVLIAPAFAAPSLPAAFYGSAEINGRAIPVNSVITAEINDVQKGSITTSEGKYGGYYAAEGKLVVYDGANGNAVIFYIQTSQMTNKIKAAQTGTWLSGSNQKLDLTFTGTELLKTGTSPAPSSGGGGGGGGGTSTTTKSADDGTATTTTTETEPNEQGVQNTVQALDNKLINSGSVSFSLLQGDSATFNLYAQHTLALKVLGTDAVIVTLDRKNVLVNIGETSDADLNNDGSDDVAIKLEKIAKNKATFSMTKLAAVTALPSSPATGLAFGSGIDANLAIIVFAIIIILIVAFFVIKKGNMISTTTLGKKSTIKPRRIKYK